MKSLLLDLVNNANTILSVREKLLSGCGFEARIDVDADAAGFWLKKEVFPAEVCYIGVHVRPGQGVYLKIDSPIKCKNFEGAPSFEEIMGQIDEFEREICDEIPDEEKQDGNDETDSDQRPRNEDRVRSHLS